MQEVLWLERLERQLLRPRGATRIHYDLHLRLTSGKVIIEGSLEVKLPTKWTDEKAEVGRVREEKKRRSKKIREEKESEERRCRCVNHCVFSMFFQCFGAPEGPKVGSLKRRVRSRVGR